MSHQPLCWNEAFNLPGCDLVIGVLLLVVTATDISLTPLFVLATVPQLPLLSVVHLY